VNKFLLNLVFAGAQKHIFSRSAAFAKQRYVNIVSLRAATGAGWLPVTLIGVSTFAYSFYKFLC
jgi:hypothetical protein